MTGARRSDSGSARDRDRVVATLRRELLVPFEDELASSHLEAMLLEFDWKLDPEPDTEPVHRRPILRVRSVVASCIAAATLTVTGGFAAAGALPTPAQHWLSRATRIVGIRLPDSPAPTPAPRVNTPNVKTRSATTPSTSRPRAIAPSREGPKRSVPLPAPGRAPAPSTTVPTDNAGRSEKAKNSEAEKQGQPTNNAGGNGNANDNSNAGGNGIGNGKPQKSDAASGAGEGKATAPGQVKQSAKD